MYDINFHENIDNRVPLMMAQGAFASLCRNYSVEIIRGDLDFAVEAIFPYHVIVYAFKEVFKSKLDRGINRSMIMVNYDEINQMINQKSPKKSSFNEIKLFLPHEEIAIQTNLTKAVGLGATEHELGHIICDLANDPPKANYYDRLKTELILFARNMDPRFTDTHGIKETIKMIDGLFMGLARWVNIFMDIRLENMMRFMYPSTKHRFISLQEYIFQIESLSTEQDFTSIFPLIIRDLGKNHESEALTQRLKFYQDHYPFAYHLAMENKAIWQTLQIKSNDCVGTAHLPFKAAMEILIKLNQQVEIFEQKTQVPPQISQMIQNELKKTPQDSNQSFKEMIPLIKDCIDGKFRELDAGKMLSEEIKSQIKSKLDTIPPSIAHQKYIPSKKKILYLKNNEASFRMFKH